MDKLEFLKSINDGKTRHLSNTNMQDVFNGKNVELNNILQLQHQGYLDLESNFVNGSLTITGYSISEKGEKYIESHSKSAKLKSTLKKLI